MGRDKQDRIERDEAQHEAAKRDERRCPYCDAVVPYGTDFGPRKECPACVGALKDE